MRLIDADALEHAVQASIAEHADVYTGEMIVGMRSVVFYATNGAPTVDAVPVIRCKDCKHYTGYECQRSKVFNIRVITNEDDYCSRAERRRDDRRQNNTV